MSLPIRQGEVLALIGPSGCGKTTLLRSLNRLTELTRGASLSGRITLDGIDIAAIEPTLLRRRVTMVFQQPNPFPMSVFDNVAYVLREQAARRPRERALRGAVERRARPGRAARRGGKDNLDHPALRLSGGQQQRLCIARALAANPEVLLLDEPCSALDPQSTQVIEDLIVKLREDVAVVIVTHNLQQAYRVADYVAFMYLGELVEYATAHDLRLAHASSEPRTTSAVPSVRRVSAAFVATAPSRSLLAGCVSHADGGHPWPRLVDARIIASQSQTEVTAGESFSERRSTGDGPRPPRATRSSCLSRNDSARQLTDLPISVGVRTSSGRTTCLNSSTTLDYFHSHILPSRPDASTDWVFTKFTVGALPRGRVFATVGVPRLHPTLSRSLPFVAVSLRARYLATGCVILKLSVLNRSVIPQYDVPVYAVALRHGREVAAGRTAVTHLGTRGTSTSLLALLGGSHYDSLRLVASPTIFK